jgi:hypothetical protein
MKTLKLALVATFVAFLMTDASYADGFRSNPHFKKVINMPLAQAVQNPGLVQAIYEQVYEADVFDVHQYNYAPLVVYQKKTYRIIGDTDQWKRFFRMKGISPATKKTKAAVID